MRLKHLDAWQATTERKYSNGKIIGVPEAENAGNTKGKVQIYQKKIS